MGLLLDAREVRLPVWRRGIVAAAVAGLANLSIYLVARSVGVSFRIRGQADVFITFQDLTTGFRWIRVWNVVVDSILPILFGTFVFWLAARRSRSTAIATLVIGTLFLCLSITVPWTVRIEGATRAVLVVMQLVVWLAYVASLVPALANRRR
jgi:hypothetical protein